FIWSLTYTDLACTWTEGRAVWNKGAQGVLEQTKDVEHKARLPRIAEVNRLRMENAYFKKRP
ncbi:MAG: hypothetical protein HGA28_08150, partial [Anaerolineaceae bacterium]|nr:hypothetical protein [Anaerolineaceae bacterium]